MLHRKFEMIPIKIGFLQLLKLLQMLFTVLYCQLMKPTQHVPQDQLLRYSTSLEYHQLQSIVISNYLREFLVSFIQLENFLF